MLQAQIALIVSEGMAASHGWKLSDSGYEDLCIKVAEKVLQLDAIANAQDRIATVTAERNEAFSVGTALEADLATARKDAKKIRIALTELMRWTNESPPQWLDYEMHDEYRAAVNRAKDALGYARRHAAQPEAGAL